MTKRKSDFTLPTNSLDELFSSQEERDDAKLERVRDIPSAATVTTTNTTALYSWTSWASG